MNYIDDFAEDATVTFDINMRDHIGASQNPTVNGTLAVYKNMDAASRITAGVTYSAAPFNGLAGIGKGVVDMSADAAYVTGADFFAILEGVTIDGQVVNSVVAHWSCENRFTNVNQVGGTAQTAGDLAALITTVDGVVDNILADTAEIGAAGAGLTEAGGTGDHLTAIITDLDDIKGTGFAKDTHSLTNIEGYADLIDDGTSGLAKIATDAAAILVGTVTNAQGADVATDVANMIDANNRVDVGSWLGTAVTTSATTNKPEVDVNSISDDATAADNLEASATGIIPGTAQTGTLSTTVMTSDLSGYLDDELIGRVIIWTSGTADGQASTITDYASASGTVTYVTITTAPANGDLFVIV